MTHLFRRSRLNKCVIVNTLLVLWLWHASFGLDSLVACLIHNMTRSWHDSFVKRLICQGARSQQTCAPANTPPPQPPLINTLSLHAHCRSKLQNDNLAGARANNNVCPRALKHITCENTSSIALTPGYIYAARRIWTMLQTAEHLMARELAYRALLVAVGVGGAAAGLSGPTIVWLSRCVQYVCDQFWVGVGANIRKTHRTRCYGGVHVA